MRLSFTMVILSMVFNALAQIPDWAVAKAERKVDSLTSYHEVPNPLVYSCDASYTRIHDEQWPACIDGIPQVLPDFSSYHERGKHEEYVVVFDYVDKARIEEFAYVMVSHNSQVFTYSEFLNYYTIPQFGRINYTESGAREIARRFGLKPGVKDWQIQFTCGDLSYWPGAKKLDDNEYMYMISATYSIDEKCNMQGQRVFISAYSGKLLHEEPWSAPCIVPMN